MPSTSVTVPVDSRPISAPAARPAHGNTRIPRNIAAAIDLMIEEGKPWDDAARQSNVTVRTMRLALQRPHVVSYLKAKREVFRVHASAANIHRLVEMRDQDENKMAAVTAIKALEQIGESEQASRGSQALPGLQIVIVQGQLNQPLNTPDTNRLITIGNSASGPAQEPGP